MSTPSSIPSYGAELRASVAPYSLPITGSVAADLGTSVVRANVGPYVPGPWRGKPAAAAPSASSPLSGTPTLALDASLGVEQTGVAVTHTSATTPPLPWIDAFLSSTPVMPMRAVTEPRVAVPTPESAAAVALDATPSSGAWALDEAAERMRALADELRDHDVIASASTEALRGFDAVSRPTPLPAWSAEDMIDIMPLRKDHPSARDRSPHAESSGSHQSWADRAGQVGNESVEAAAQALELLARRVRDGDIVLSGYEPRLGDAAALAAALAALLGVRR